MGTQFRSLGENDAIQVYYSKTGVFDGRVSQGQHFRRIAALVGGIGIGKELAYVPQVRGAEKRVGDGVQQNIGVAMPNEMLFKRDRHTPQAQRPAKLKPMSIV